MVSVLVLIGLAMSDSYLFDLGWLFFGAWSILVAVVSVTAFAPELFPSKANSFEIRRVAAQKLPNISPSK